MTPPADGLKPWLRKHLETQGHIDPDTGATETARLTRCPRCRRPTWIALEPHGLARRLDTDPLTPLGEALAILNGRTTCGLYRQANTLRIEPRTLDRIRGHPAATPNTDVLLEHKCTQPPLNLPTTETALKWPAANTPPTDPPF